MELWRKVRTFRGGRGGEFVLPRSRHHHHRAAVSAYLGPLALGCALGCVLGHCGMPSKGLLLFLPRGMTFFSSDWLTGSLVRNDELVVATPPNSVLFSTGYYSRTLLFFAAHYGRRRSRIVRPRVIVLKTAFLFQPCLPAATPTARFGLSLPRTLPRVPRCSAERWMRPPRPSRIPSGAPSTRSMTAPSLASGAPPPPSSAASSAPFSPRAVSGFPRSGSRVGTSRF